MNKLFVAILFLAIVSCTEKKAVEEERISKEETELIDYLFEGATGSRPGANVLVIEKGEIVFQKSYGLSNVEEKTKSIPTTNYRIASVAKQFTAMAIMLLEHQGKLSYETKLTDLFPDFPAYGKTINVRHLLTHQSGVIDYDEFIAENSTKQLLDADVLAGLKNIDSTYFIPGSQFRYSNSGYALLAQIVEKASGDTFANFMNKEIFEKLKMTSTQVFELDQPIANRAYGYSIKNDSIELNDQSTTSAIQGDGGIYSNVLDYYKWDQALYTDQLIPLEKLQEAFYDYDNNEQTNKEGYGYGWSIEHNKSTKILDHSGGTAGFETWVKRIPSLELTVVVFANRDGHDRHLMHRMNALVSIYSDYKIPMPVEIMMKKAVDQKGVSHGVKIYDQLKKDARFEFNQTTPNYLAFEYFRVRKLDKAKGLFYKAIDEFPTHFGGYYGLGRVYSEQNEFDKAISNFEKVLELGTGGEADWILDRSKNEIAKLMEMKKLSN